MALGKIILALLDALIRAVQIAINAIYRILDVLIETVERVARLIASLIYNGLRLLFYLFPFLSMVFIGNREHLEFLWYTGIIFLSAFAVLFLRELLAHAIGSKDKVESEELKIGRAFLAVLILNLMVFGYVVFSFQNEIQSNWNAFRAFMSSQHF